MSDFKSPLYDHLEGLGRRRRLLRLGLDPDAPVPKEEAPKVTNAAEEKQVA